MDIVLSSHSTDSVITRKGCRQRSDLKEAVNLDVKVLLESFRGEESSENLRSLSELGKFGRYREMLRD